MEIIYSQAEAVKTSASEHLQILARFINQGKYVASSSVRPDQARDMVAANLITEKQLSLIGVQW